MSGPKALEFPKNLNPHAITAWFKACENLPEDPKLAWRQAMGIYVETCTELGLDPFYQGERNSAIRNFLYARRRHFVRFMDATKLMRGLKVIMNVKRAVVMQPYGFDITVSSQLRIPDPTWYKQLFSFSPVYRFSRLREGRRYVLHLDPGLEVFIYNDEIAAASRWHIGYTVKCPLTPDPEGLDPKTYVLDHLWKPLSTAYRPQKVDKIRYI